MRQTFTLAFPFPLIRLAANVNYYTVRKASGIGYMLMVLIHDSKNRQDSLSAVLRSFGVCDDMLFIFEQEINLLIAGNILRMSDNSAYQVENFSNYTLADFAFTDLGERLFKEGYVPTNEMRSKPVLVYYNPLNRELSLQPSGSIRSLEKSPCYPPDFMNKVETDFSGLNDFFISNSGRIDLKNEERVASSDPGTPEYFYVKYEDRGELNFDNRGMEISFGLAGAGDFYKKYFAPDMLERELVEQYQFPFEPQKLDQGFGCFEFLSDIHKPAAYKDKHAVQSGMLIEMIEMEKEGGGIKLTLDKINVTLPKAALGKIGGIKKRLDSPSSFLVLDKKDLSAFIPVNIPLREKALDKTVRINLLIEELFPAELRKLFLDSLVSSVADLPPSKDVFRFVKSFIRFFPGVSLRTEDYLKTKLAEVGSVYEKTEILAGAHAVFDRAECGEFLKTQAKEIYKKEIEGISMSSLQGKIRSLEKILELAGVSRNNFAGDIAKHLEQENYSVVSVFNALQNSGFSAGESMPVANIAEFYMSEILNGNMDFEKSVISDSFIAVGNNLKTLKTALGIISPADYVFKSDYDKNDFIDRFKTLEQHQYLDIKKYAPWAPEQFAELEKYLALMRRKYDVVMAERLADSTDAEKISLGQIKRLLNSGSYLEALLLIAKKLEYILKIRYPALKDKSLGSLLHKAGEDADFPTEYLADLQRLNDWGIDARHVTEKRVKLDKEKLSSAADTVFALAGKLGIDKGKQK